MTAPDHDHTETFEKRIERLRKELAAGALLPPPPPDAPPPPRPWNESTDPDEDAEG